MKYWLEVGSDEQERRFKARIEDPLRQWKLSPMDLPSRSRWYDYSRARDMMLEATDTDTKPWHIVHSDDKKRARLNCISHLLILFRMKMWPTEKIDLPSVSTKRQYDDEATLKDRKFIPQSTESPGHLCAWVSFEYGAGLIHGDYGINEEGSTGGNPGPSTAS